MDRLKLPIVILIVGLGVCFYLVSKVMDNNVKVIELVKESQQTTQLEPKPEEVPTEPTPKLKQDLDIGDGATNVIEMDDEEWCRDFLKETEAWEAKKTFEDSINFYDKKVRIAEGKISIYEKDYQRCDRMLKAAKEDKIPNDSKYLAELRDDCRRAFEYHPVIVKNYDDWKKEKADFLKSLRKKLEAQQ